ncbi:MAG: DUF4369 domain-containing protein [Bacteroidaceae bacterium]|nr:DUF4369 domain-containing protein [Bacteroidaceae bacterium]
MKRPLHILYILGLILSVASCGPEGNSFRIKGSFRDMEGGELYIYNLSDDYPRLDTLKIQEGKFLYRGLADEVVPFILVFPNGMEQVIFAGPGDDLRYEATANDLRNYVVNGSEENKLMNQFRQETYTFRPSRVAETARTYIKMHPDSPVAIYLFDRYYVQDEEVSDKELADLLTPLKKAFPHSHYLLDIDTKMKALQRIQVGKKLPDVTLTQKDKKTKKLWASERDYNLITFWATWMPNGFDYLWKLRKSNDAYKDAGRLRMVAISFDIERYRWEDAIRPDSTNHIEHYCDGLSFESKMAKTLGVDNLPSYILTDKEHKILEKGTDLEELAGTLKKYLDKSSKSEKEK